MKPEHCPCVDFESVDPDDSLSVICTCGHVIEEHEGGFFRRCEFNTDEEGR